MTAAIADVIDRLPRFSDFASYPNNRSKHQLRIFKNGIGVCSCDAWELSGASVSSCIESHMLHIDAKS